MSINFVLNMTVTAAHADDETATVFSVVETLHRIANQIEAEQKVDGYWTTVFDTEGNDIGRFCLKPGE